MKRKWIGIFILVPTLLFGFLAACTAQDGTRVSDIWVRAAILTSPVVSDQAEAADEGHGNLKIGSTNSAAYLVIRNEGDQDDRLLSVECDAARVVELHKSTLHGDVMQMQRVDAIKIPVGETIELKTGGYHIMLIDLNHSLVADEKLPMTLVFEHAGRIDVEADVRMP